MKSKSFERNLFIISSFIFLLGMGMIVSIPKSALWKFFTTVGAGVGYYLLILINNPFHTLESETSKSVQASDSSNPILSNGNEVKSQSDTEADKMEVSEDEEADGATSPSIESSELPTANNFEVPIICKKCKKTCEWDDDGLCPDCGKEEYPEEEE